MDLLRVWFSTRRAKALLALAPVVAFALWSNTLTDHIGYGSALIAGLYGSIAGALLGASGARRLRALDTPYAHAEAVLVAALSPLVPLVVIALGVLAHGLVAPACGPAQGALYWLLVALPGPCLAGLVGFSLGAAIDRKGGATGLGAALVPGFVVWSLLRFYATPAIFAYDPFYGFFPGAIYDEEVPLGMALVTYRIGTLAWIIAFAAWLLSPWSPMRSWRAARGRASSAVAALAFISGVGMYLAGPSLGHRTGRDDMLRALEGRASSTRCDVVYDRTLDARQARATARDCDLRVGQIERFFGVHETRRITVFLFANAAQKQALMGAADTYIAKPWRAEVYLQYAPFPHPVLKHELAHAVAAAMAPGPLHVTSLGRLMPVPGLIEGAAVAAAWEGESDATAHQWSRAMLDAGMAPRVRTLTGLGFFAASSLTAYTAAGSFCRWLIETRGQARFQNVYARGDFERAYGRSLPALESDWHRFLRTVEVPDETLAKARARFHRASIFGRQCPFEREAREETAALHLHAGDLVRATAELDELSRRDPSDLRTRGMLAMARVRGGDVAGAVALAREAGRVSGPAAEARVMSRVADAVWRWRGEGEALAIYRTLDLRLFDEDEARTIGLKLTLAARGGAWAEALRDLLVGRGELDASAPVASARLAALWRETHDPLAAYLVARQYFLAERHDDVVVLLDDATLAAMTDARVRAEATRIAAVSSYHRGDRARAAALFARIAEDPARPMGDRDEARDWIDRITREATAR